MYVPYTVCSRHNTVDHQCCSPKAVLDLVYALSVDFVVVHWTMSCITGFTPTILLMQ